MSVLKHQNRVTRIHSAVLEMKHTLLIGTQTPGTDAHLPGCLRWLRTAQLSKVGPMKRSPETARITVRDPATGKVMLDFLDRYIFPWLLTCVCPIHLQ